MTAKARPTAEDRVAAIRIALQGIAFDADLGDMALQLEPLHPRNNTFPGEVLLELAADALELSGASREDPVEYEGIRERVSTRAPLQREYGASQEPLRLARCGNGPRWNDT